MVNTFWNEYWLQILLPVLLIIITIGVNLYGSIDARKKYNKVLPILILTTMLIIIRKVWVNHLVNWKAPDIIYMVLMSLYFIFYFFIYYEKYYTAGFVIAQGCKGCYYTPPLKIGKYTIFNVGSSCKTFPMEQGDFVLVVPSELVTYIGALAYVNCVVTRRDYTYLPNYVKRTIQDNKNYNINDVWYGRFDKETLVYGTNYTNKEGKKITPSECQEELLMAYHIINTYQGFNDNEDMALERRAGSLKRISKAITGKNIFTIKTEKPTEEYGQ